MLSSCRLVRQQLLLHATDKQLQSTDPIGRHALRETVSSCKLQNVAIGSWLESRPRKCQSAMALTHYHLAVEPIILLQWSSVLTSLMAQVAPARPDSMRWAAGAAAGSMAPGSGTLAQPTAATAAQLLALGFDAPAPAPEPEPAASENQAAGTI